jgi:hypothetical protein
VGSDVDAGFSHGSVRVGSVRHGWVGTGKMHCPTFDPVVFQFTIFISHGSARMLTNLAALRVFICVDLCDSWALLAAGLFLRSLRFFAVKIRSRSVRARFLPRKIAKLSWVGPLNRAAGDELENYCHVVSVMNSSSQARF